MMMENPFDKLEQRLTNIEKILLSLQNQEQPQSPETDTWFNIDELCQYLPSKPTKPTVYGWTQAKKIPFHKTGKSLVFRKSEIDTWLSSNRIKTIAEIDAEADSYIKHKR